METELPVPACDDGFSEFIHDRTTKQKLNKESSIHRTGSFTSPINKKVEICLKNLEASIGSSDSAIKNICASDETLYSTNEVNELLRSEGSGSENGLNDDLLWYRNEKSLTQKSRNGISYTPIHKVEESNVLNSKHNNNISPVKYEWLPKSQSTEWRSRKTDSFESNPEYTSCDYGSPLDSRTARSEYGMTYQADRMCHAEGMTYKDATDLDEDDEWEPGDRPTGERWPPLGAPNDDETSSIGSFEELGRARCAGDVQAEAGCRLREMEEEQEQLSSSLLALTSHFAQVQFRLKQIVVSEAGEKERLLKELEDFADRGVPDIRAIQQTRDAANTSIGDLAGQRELIQRLKEQLDELEQYAYHTGEAGLPQAVLVQKQKVIIDQLKGRLQLNLEDLGQISVEELRKQVDACVKEMTV